jgi:hypothetical protein
VWEALAKPGQVGFFTKDRGDGSFDYDCDGQTLVEHAVANPGYCVCGSFGGCSVSTGWSASVPACGVAASYDVGGDGRTCAPIVETRVQGCR